MKPAVYIRTNPSGGILYIGVTANLPQRNQAYLLAINPNSYVNRHHLTKLVHVENFHTISEAIAREKHLKNLTRNRKLKLITEHNPMWHDLSSEIWDES